MTKTETKSMTKQFGAGLKNLLGLLLIALTLYAAPYAEAGDFCSDAPYFGVIDGDVLGAPPIQITIDTDCTFQNWPQSNPLTTTVNFQTNDPSIYLIIFDNVEFIGNMACANVDHRIWFSNGSDYGTNNSCQDLFIPVESIAKKNPPGQTTASIGVPFTYTLTLPSMTAMGGPSLNDLHTVALWDDLAATGADLTFVSLKAYYKGSGDPVTLIPEDDPTARGGVWTSKNLSYKPISLIPNGEQIIVELTVVPDDAPANAAGTTFVNVAKWSFGRLIDGVFYEPLPGEWGVSEPMTIAEPNLAVSKGSDETALNFGVSATFFIDVQNIGGAAAWNAAILDNIPADMCDYDPTAAPGVSAQLFAADGVTPVSGPLVEGTDFSATFSGAPNCQLAVSMETAAIAIEPSQHLIISYQSEIDADSADGATLTNVAGATRWFNGPSTLPSRKQFDRGPLTDGTPGIVDFQDSHTVTTALSGYYFQKTVQNLVSGVNPAATAAPGDRLRYRLRLFNIDQDIYSISFSDVLDPASFDLGSFIMTTLPGTAAYSFDAGTGQLTINGNGAPLNAAPGDELIFEFEIDLTTTLADGTVVENQATLTATGLTAYSDNPYVNGIAPPGEPADPTSVLIQAPEALTKTNTQASAAIGEQFKYRVAVPATPFPEPLNDVKILDNLALSNADLRFVGASVVSGGSWTLTNTGSAVNLVIEDLTTGIDIPANGQAVIEITVELKNTTTDQSGLSFANSASYTYNRMNGNSATQTTGDAGSTGNMTVVEPVLIAAKIVNFFTPAGKQPTDPAAVGDVLEYTLTIASMGTSTAFDASVVDALPAELTLVPGSAAARINGVPVSGFVANPTTLPNGALAWGGRNGDLSLDIPVGDTLVLTYQASVEALNGADIDNSAYVDWTSLDGGNASERTGAGCPAADTLNDYCYGPITVGISTVDNASISKAAVGDSYAETPPAAADPIVRVGDVVTYALTLNLQEYTTRNVVVEDALPEGLALESFTIDGGDNFSYTLAALPAVGATGVLRWEFGYIVNQPSNDGTPLDALVIQYVAKVVAAAPPVGAAYDVSIAAVNLAQLSYQGGDPAAYPDRLTATETISIRQPHMSAISKVDLGSGRVGAGTSTNPYQVNIAADVMNFRLATCNDGLAPAYGVVVSDQLAPELDESDLAADPPLVSVGSATLTSGADYTLVLPGRGGELQIALQDAVAVNPNECIRVDYNIGFHTDLTASKSWSNLARVPEYQSLPPSDSGRLYTSTGQAEVWMTNLVNQEQLLKTLMSPTEATIGDEVAYKIVVPAIPVNTALNNVVVVDALSGALEYVGASAVDDNGVEVGLTDNSAPPGSVSLEIASIPAGRQVIITLRARVANNAQANAGLSFSNTASYSYARMPAGLDTSSTSGPLTIVEPTIALAKTVANLSRPGLSPQVGDVLRYTLNFTAAGGTAGDQYSDAFDLSLVDSLGLGLAYQNGTAVVSGSGNDVADPMVAGDGDSVAQTLTWSLSDGNADIDVVEGTQVALSYDVVVLSGALPGQELVNSAAAQWTGLDGDEAFERTGSGAPAENDYFTGPVSQTVQVGLAVAIAKSVVNATTGEDPGANATPGDMLRYTLALANESIAPLTNASVVDDLAAQFVPGSLQLISVSDSNADAGNTSASGGANATGVIDIRNLTLAAQGNPGDSQTIVFEAQLAPVISSGTAVLNQAQLSGDSLAPETSNQTSTLINSAPAFEVWKSSQDMTGDPEVLMAGDTLRYTIVIENIGNENAVDALLRDQIPGYASYAPGSTTLNGAPVADPAPGVSPLENGLQIHGPADSTPGVMLAEATGVSGAAATVVFEVVVDSNLVDGSIIANQGFVSASGAGGGLIPEEPTDDPDTDIINDPTLDVVGNLPLVDALKTVQILIDNGSAGVVDPGDVLHYVITITNTGAAQATGVVLTDAIPENTTYVADSVRLNGLPVGQPDGGVSPLISGIDVGSDDQTPPLPGVGNGALPIGGTAVVDFDVQVNAGVEAGTIISNQGVVSCEELLDEPTDADGNDANGDQPTQVAVGPAQQLSILKQVSVIGGGAALPGGKLEYELLVTNIGSVPATQATITDDLGPLAGQASYVADSGSMNGSTVGVTYSGSIVSANYAAQYGDLQAGDQIVVRFRVQIDAAAPTGATLTNTGVVNWNNPIQTQSATAVIDVGGTPGSGTLSGSVWHDVNLNQLDDAEQQLADWSVELYRGSQLLATVLSDADGSYRLSGLEPNTGAAVVYELHFLAPGAGANTPSLGKAVSTFTNGPQRITDITVGEGEILQNLNLPITPNGTVYDSVRRTPVVGAQLTLTRAATGAPLPSSCFDDPVQQAQVTPANGFYKFDLNFSDPSCPPGGDYLIMVEPPGAGYDAYPSRIIPPANNAETPSFSVPACLGAAVDAVPATIGYCEATTSALAPPLSVAPRTAGTTYYLHLTLDDGAIPGQSQIFNNPIPLDPVLNGAASITKTAAKLNMRKGDLAPYTITVHNVNGAPLTDLSIVDRFPAGFKYVENSARLDGVPSEPVVEGRILSWDNLVLQTNQSRTLQLLLAVGGGVAEDEYVNRAQVLNTMTGGQVSGVATATVRVVPDPTFDCTDVIGKVFDDRNLNGRQDEGEPGLSGVRLATVRGLIASTDRYGRFHVACAQVPDQERGSNFILKLDDHSLPTGYRLTTENPRVQRATRGKMLRFNFGATIHRVVTLDVADAAYDPESAELRLQWQERLNQLVRLLEESPSVLRLSYLADVEDEALVQSRLKKLKKEISGRWERSGSEYQLTIETEVFWRRGSPP